MQQRQWTWDIVQHITEINTSIKTLSLEARFRTAIQKAQLEVIKKCLDDGVNPNNHCGDQVTALHKAAERGRLDLLQLLLHYPETNIDMGTVHGWTPINLACRQGHLHIVKELLKRGADPNIGDKYENTPLHSAVFGQRIEIATVLLQNNAKPTMTNIYGYTALHLAIKEVPNKKIAKLLLDNNADINFYVPKMTMPILMECCLICHTAEQLSMVEFVLINGGKINSKCLFSQRCALHIAAFTGNIALITLLLEHGANRVIKDLRGEMPYEMALRHENYEAAMILKPLDLESIIALV